MKYSLIILAVIALLLLSSTPFYASYADTEQKVYYIAGEDTPFYDNLDNVLFYVPHSYYLEKTGEPTSGNFYYVKYNGVEGKVRKVDVTTTSLTSVINPFYTNSLTIAENEDFILVHNVPALNADEKLFINDKALIFHFIGIMYDQQDNPFYYVRYTTDRERYGYLIPDKTSNSSLIDNIVKHPNYVDPIDNPPTDDPPVIADPPADLLRVLLILGISIPAVIVLFLLFRPSGRRNSKRPTRGRDYYDDGYYDTYEDDMYYDDYRDPRRDYRRRR